MGNLGIYVLIGALSHVHDEALWKTQCYIYLSSVLHHETGETSDEKFFVLIIFRSVSLFELIGLVWWRINFSISGSDFTRVLKGISLNE